MMWKVQHYLKMAAPWLVILTLAFGGYTLHKRGVFRRGVPSLGKILSHIPIIGKRFSRYDGGSYARAPYRSYKRYGRHHRSRRHGRRR